MVMAWATPAVVTTVSTAYVALVCAVLVGGFLGIHVPPPTAFGYSIDPTSHPGRYALAVLLGLTGVALVTDKPVSGVDAIDTTKGAELCWGKK